MVLIVVVIACLSIYWIFKQGIRADQTKSNSYRIRGSILIKKKEAKSHSSVEGRTALIDSIEFTPGESELSFMKTTMASEVTLKSGIKFITTPGKKIRIRKKEADTRSQNSYPSK